MCDKLVYDLAQEVEGSPCVFIRKDWINILDNQNQNYISNQSVLDTSQLSNSNKWMSYREAYFSVPLMITVASQNAQQKNVNTGGALVGNSLWEPAIEASASDQSVGLKNWFGNIIHSFTLDYNGTTIIQQTPFVNMWNSFKLMTSLSYQDVITQGCTIGFYPDSPETWEFYQGSVGQDGTADTSLITTPAAPNATSSWISGTGTCNNTNYRSFITSLPTKFTNFQTGLGNPGFVERCKWISFDIKGTAGASTSAAAYGYLLAGGAGPIVGANASNGTTALNNLWKGYIIKKQNQLGTTFAQTTPGMIQYAVMATIYLKHIHSFFNMIPLLKGVFMKMTMNLNNCSSTVICGGNCTSNAIGAQLLSTNFSACQSVQSALGGVNMLMLASGAPGNGAVSLNKVTSVTSVAAATITSYAKTFRMNLSVGGTCLDSSIINATNAGVITTPLSKSIYLYIPAYTFNPTFEQAYLSSPVKQIKYTDIYQYQVLNVAGSTGQINNLLTNGIANVKSVLILPFYSTQGTTTPATYAGICDTILSDNSGFASGQPVWASPFDPAGCGATSPLCHLTNFNIQVSGQNAIYNLQKYSFEQFNNQLYGQNAVNGGLTDGITSSLIDRQAFDLEYCYYYVNIERMLPVEQSVPKSIQLIGTNQSSKALDLLCFIEYGTEVSIDSLTGARV
jgi:hypothetical protein